MNDSGCLLLIPEVTLPLLGKLDLTEVRGATRGSILRPSPPLVPSYSAKNRHCDVLQTGCFTTKYGYVVLTHDDFGCICEEVPELQTAWREFAQKLSSKQLLCSMRELQGLLRY